MILALNEKVTWYMRDGGNALHQLNWNYTKNNIEMKAQKF